MTSVKPLLGLLLFVGVTSICMLSIHYSSKADEMILTKKINTLDTKIDKLETELSFLSKVEKN